MIAQTLSKVASLQMIWMTCIALILFFAFFTGLLLWTARSQNRRHYQAMSHMPLQTEFSEGEVKP